jgi:hypothetical protein
LQILTDPRLGRSPVAASALSALLPDQFCQDDHGFELLSKLEQKWPTFRLESLAESVDRQHQEMGLGEQLTHAGGFLSHASPAILLAGY